MGAPRALQDLSCLVAEVAFLVEAYRAYHVEASEAFPAFLVACCGPRSLHAWADPCPWVGVLSSLGEASSRGEGEEGLPFPTLPAPCSSAFPGCHLEGLDPACVEEAPEGTGLHNHLEEVVAYQVASQIRVAWVGEGCWIVREGGQGVGVWELENFAWNLAEGACQAA